MKHGSSNKNTFYIVKRVYDVLCFGFKNETHLVYSTLDCRASKNPTAVLFAIVTTPPWIILLRKTLFEPMCISRPLPSCCVSTLRSTSMLELWSSKYMPGLQSLEAERKTKF